MQCLPPDEFLNSSGLNIYGPTPWSTGGKDDGLAFVEAGVDVIDYSFSAAILSGPEYQDSNAFCRIDFWYYYNSLEENPPYLEPTLRHLGLGLSTTLDYLPPHGKIWRFARSGIGRRFVPFQVMVVGHFFLTLEVLIHTIFNKYIAFFHKSEKEI